MMAWLVNSMELKIRQTYLSVSITNKMWDIVSGTFSNLGTSGQVYEIKTRIRETKQVAQGVTKYYVFLRVFGKS